MIRKEDFTFKTNCKGQIFGTRKITNNSNYIVFYQELFVGEVGSKTDAIKYIDNLVEHQKLTYTAKYI